MSGAASQLVRAAGTVPWRVGDTGGIEVALVHRPRYDDWSLPKGKLDPGEGWRAAAVRETEEEAGLTGEVGAELCAVAYRVAEGPKLVRYWLLRVSAAEFAPNHEVDQVSWLPYADVLSRAPYRGDRAVLRSAAGLLAPVAPASQS